MPGRKPRPTHLKVVEGNPGRRPLNKREPKPRGSAVKPGFLSERARVAWDAHAPELTRLGLLTSVDGVMFAVWCELVAEFERGPADMPSSRISQMRALASSFGLDPSARARLGGSGDVKAEDPAEAFFA